MKMNASYAASILGIEGEVTPEIVKKAYQRACMKYHPDRNPSGLEMMKAVNQAYESLKDVSEPVKRTVKADYGDKLNAAFNAIRNLDGITIELKGAWLWVTGNTKPHKETLKEAGFKWAPVKKAWHFRDEEYKSSSRGKYTLEQIDEKYGSHTLKEAKKQRQLTA